MRVAVKYVEIGMWRAIVSPVAEAAEQIVPNVGDK